MTLPPTDIIILLLIIHSTSLQCRILKRLSTGKEKIGWSIAGLLFSVAFFSIILRWALT